MPEAAGGGGAQLRRSSDRQDGRVDASRRDRGGPAVAAGPAGGGSRSRRPPPSGERLLRCLPPSWGLVSLSRELCERVDRSLPRRGALGSMGRPFSVGFGACQSDRQWLSVGFNPSTSVACQTRFKSSTAVPQPSLGLLRPPTYHLKALDELYKSLAGRKSRIRLGSPCGGPQVAVRSVELAGGCPTRSRRRCRRSSWCPRGGARCGIRDTVRPRDCGGREGSAARSTSSWT